MTRQDLADWCLIAALGLFLGFIGAVWFGVL